jgi:3-(3-hydroxy-phenyl)propionate hydroxylase
MTSGGELGNLIRHIVVPQMRHIPGLRDKIVDSATPALRRSALVHRSPRQRKLAGKLCPNPVLADGRRLDEHLGTGFALISAVPVNAEQRARLQQRGATLHIAVAGTDLADWLRRGHAAAAVIRPDRTVMRAGRQVNELCDTVPSFTLTGGEK